MGGYGSGQRAPQANRPTTDQALALDIRDLARRGALKSGRHRAFWPSVWGDASVGYAVAEDTLTLEYRTAPGLLDEPREVRQAVTLLRTPCHYGGSRPWFACPGCGDRVAILFLFGLHFRCRQCHGLAYGSTREDSSRRLLRKADRLRVNVGGEAGLGRVPPKPAWLGWRAYQRILDRIRALEAAYIAETESQVREWLSLIRGDKGET